MGDTDNANVSSAHRSEMEALVILVLEYLAVLLWPVFAFFGAMLLALTELIFEFIRAIFRGKSRRRTSKQGAESGATDLSLEDIEAHARAAAAMWRRLIGFLGVPVAIAIVPVIVANLFFFEPIARWATDRIAARTNMEIAYDTIEGNIFSGRLSISGLTVVKPAVSGPGLDLAVRTAAVDVNIWKIFAREKHIEELLVNGVTGRVAASDDGAPNVELVGPKKQKRAFAVSNLEISDVTVDVVPVDRPPVSLRISKATSPHFRSRHAAFDLFFRSNLDALVDGVPLTVETVALSDRSRSTIWRLQKAPVEPIGALVGRAPATWFQDGELSVEVDDFWDLDDLTIDMDWRLYLDNAQIAAPEGAGLRERALAGALNKAVKLRPDGVELAFQLYLDKDTFEATGSRDLTALWNAMLPGIQAALASKGIVIGQSDAVQGDTLEAVEKAPTLGEKAKSVTERVGNLFKREPSE
jgi:hypothetical protein